MGDWPDCPHCGREYRYDRSKPDVPVPPCCGEPLCRAKEYWTPEQWAGRARMAEAASVAGYQIATRLVADEKGEDKWVAQRIAHEPSEWDIEAIRRTS